MPVPGAGVPPVAGADSVISLAPHDGTHLWDPHSERLGGGVPGVAIIPLIKSPSLLENMHHMFELMIHWLSFQAELAAVLWLRPQVRPTRWIPDRALHLIREKLSLQASL